MIQKLRQQQLVWCKQNRITYGTTQGAFQKPLQYLSTTNKLTVKQCALWTLIIICICMFIFFQKFILSHWAGMKFLLFFYGARTDLTKEEWTEFTIHSFIRQDLKVWVGLRHLINCNISCDYIIYQITRPQTTCPLGKQSVKVLQSHTREITAVHINTWDSAT